MPRTLFLSVVAASLFVAASLACSGFAKPGKSDPVAEPKSELPEKAKQDKPAPQPSKPPIRPGGGDEPEPKQPKPPADKPFSVVHIDSFLGISPDFNAYAKWDADSVKMVDLETGKNLTSPKWDRDWGSPSSAAIGKDFIAVVTSKSVKIFSRKTGELEQNVRGNQITMAAFTADQQLLAFTDWLPPGQGYHLILRDIGGKKTVAEVSLEGWNGYCYLLAAEKFVATYELYSDQVTVVEAESGKLVKKLKCGSFRERKGFGQALMPITVSPAGNLIACTAEDAIVLYDLASEKVTHKLAGHLDFVQAIAFPPNGEIVASAAKDKTIRFWNVKEGKEISIIKNLPASPTELIFSTDGNRIAVVYPAVSGEWKKAEIRSVNLK